MKKIVPIFAAFSLAILIGIPNAHAQSPEKVTKEQKAKVIYHQEEIKDLSQLFKRAKEGKNDVSLESLNLPDYKLINNSTKNEEKIEKYTTTQLLDVQQQNDSVVETIAATTFVGVPTNTLTTNNSIIAPSLTTQSTVSPLGDGGGSNYQYSWDSSIRVEAYSTIYYSKTVQSDGNTYAKLTSANGGWYISDYTVSLSGRSVALGTSGWPIGTQSVTYYPSSDSWSYSAPSTWQYVSLVSGHSIGATSSVTLKRGTRSTWTLTLSNNI